MSTKFTLSTLIRYVYDETSEQETDQLVCAMRQHKKLYYAAAEVLDLKRKLTKAQVQPSAEVIDKILSYAGQQNKVAADSPKH